MTTYYMTRLTLCEQPRVQALLREVGNAYREHQMLWRVFPPAPHHKRDFLYRRDISRGRPRYLILSQRRPVNTLGIWAIDPPKPFAPKLRRGQRLVFSLRANPVVSRNGKRHDIVMDRKRQLGWHHNTPSDRPLVADLIHQTGMAWLNRQAERHGFSCQSHAVRVEGYRQHCLRYRHRSIRFSTLDFNGLLTVTNPQAFLSALYHGIGPAKAFGCGLMLVRPA